MPRKANDRYAEQCAGVEVRRQYVVDDIRPRRNTSQRQPHIAGVTAVGPEIFAVVLGH